MVKKRISQGEAGRSPMLIAGFFTILLKRFFPVNARLEMMVKIKQRLGSCDFVNDGLIEQAADLKLDKKLQASERLQFDFFFIIMIII